MSFALMARSADHSSHTASASPVERNKMPASTIAPSVLIRAARGSDGVRARAPRRAGLRRVPAGTLLVAEADGRLVAAIASSTGEAIADPFLPTADVLALLQLRAAGASAPAGAAASPAVAAPAAAARTRAAAPPTGPRDRTHHPPTQDPAGRRSLPQGAGRRSFSRAGLAGLDGALDRLHRLGVDLPGDPDRRRDDPAVARRRRALRDRRPRDGRRARAAARLRGRAGRPAPSSPARRSSGCCCPAPTRSSPSPSRRCRRASPRC